MKINKFIFALIVAGLAANTFAAKPPPKPAQDLECSDPAGCVGTGDIEDGSVTTQKLSTDVLDKINQLITRIDELEKRPAAPMLYDADDNEIGRFLSYVVSGPSDR
jgi:hypothetical protein